MNDPERLDGRGTDLKIIYNISKPHGIRDNGGYLLFFPNVSKFTGQEERFEMECQEQQDLANFLLNALQIREEVK